MRFPDARLPLVAGARPRGSAAGPGRRRGACATTSSSRLREQHPALAPADLALGSAAFDPVLQRRGGRATSPRPGRPRRSRPAAGLWTRKFPNGRSLAGCFPNGGRRIAAAYPQYDARLKRVVTLETAINQCLKTHGQALLEAGDPDTMGVVLAYLRSLSEGQKIAVRVASAPAEQRFEEGRRLYITRMGQQNYACASCHLRARRAVLRRRRHPGRGRRGRRSGPSCATGRAVTLQMRIRECLDRMGAAPFPAGSDELAHLEYFLTYLSNGIPIRPNAWRPR